MRIFIVQDMEGVSGVVDWERVLAQRADGSRARAVDLMTGEINAAVEGALEAGADDVVVMESHRFLFAELHRDMRCAMGTGIWALDDSFDGVFLVGAHARARTPNAVLCHTFSSTYVHEMRLNGAPVGEIGMIAAFAGCHGVPVLLVTGDTAACDEATALLGEVQTAPVKEGRGMHSALCLSADRARELIREQAYHAVEQCGRARPYAVSTPVQLTVEYKDPAQAEKAARIPGAVREDAVTVSYTAEDFLDLYKFRDLRALLEH